MRRWVLAYSFFVRKIIGAPPVSDATFSRNFRFPPPFRETTLEEGMRPSGANMASRAFSSVLRYLHRAVGGPNAPEQGDGQLLERFITGHDQAALDAIIQRHGRLVWGVCQRLLHDPHDAEDAFQATFLVLIRKAATVEKRSSLGSWLYGVAYRIAWNALKAKASAGRRHAHERQVDD